MSNKKGKTVLSKQWLYIFVVLFCETAVDSMPCLANFSPCNPIIFCLIPTLYAHSLLKNEFFFRMFMGHYFERTRERKKLRVNRFPIWRKVIWKAQFFPSYLTQEAKSFVTTSHSVVRQDAIEISEQRTGFEKLFFAPFGALISKSTNLQGR